MRSIAFVSLALALAASAMPISIGGELRRSDPLPLPIPIPVPPLPNPPVGTLPAAPKPPVPGLPLPGAPQLPPRDLGLGSATGQTDKIAGIIAKGSAAGAANNAASAEDKLKGAVNGLAAGTGKATRDTLPVDPKMVLANGQEVAGRVEGEVEGQASGVTSKAAGAAPPVGARDATGNLPGVGSLPANVADTVNQLKGALSGAEGSVPVPPA